MKKFLQNLEYKMQRWMQGRYGYDELSKVLLIATFAIMCISCLPRLHFLYIASITLFIYSYARIFSRNIGKRRNELYEYYKLKSGISSVFSLSKRKWYDRKTHRYFKCKSCGANLRVPKHKGKIEITCPKCGKKETRKT